LLLNGFSQWLWSIASRDLTSASSLVILVLLRSVCWKLNFFKSNMSFISFNKSQIVLADYFKVEPLGAPTDCVSLLRVSLHAWSIEIFPKGFHFPNWTENPLDVRYSQASGDLLRGVRHIREIYRQVARTVQIIICETPRTICLFADRCRSQSTSLGALSKFKSLCDFDI